MKIILSLLLLLILSTCQTPLIADLVTRSGQPLYKDDFSNSTSGWIQAENNNGSLGYNDGAYRMLVQSPNFDLWAVSGQVYRDVQVEVDANRLSGPLSNRFGLVCRYRDRSNFYIFIISSDGYYAIGKVRNGTTSLLGQEMMAYTSFIHQGNNPNQLRFDCIGDTLKGAVNDQLIAITSDTDFSSGDAGLIAGSFDEKDVEISFDNFEVIKP